MQTSNVAFLVVAGVVVAGATAFLFRRETRHASRKQAAVDLLGFPGVYVAFYGVLEKLPALRIAGIGLIVASYIGHFALAKRSGARSWPPRRRTGRGPRRGRPEDEDDHAGR